MVLAQFLVTTANNDTVFPIGISGKASIRVLSMEYSATGAKAVGEVIQVISDSLYFPYSPARFLTFLTHPHGATVIDQGRTDYHLTNVSLNSGIRLQVVSKSTGAQPADFQAFVLTLSIESLNTNVMIE